MRLAAERRAVAAACRRLAAEGLVPGTAGNVSATDGELVAITPTGAVLAELDYLLSNDDHVLAFTGAGDLKAGCRPLIERGAGCVVATCGADGALVVDPDGATAVPAFEVEVVDTTGCGDAFSAGFLRGLSLGRDREAAARLGNAAAGLVAGGLGSDHGDFDLAAADELARS